ncbi:MAG: HAD family hydrolase [Candidatus Heimdallarchaeota archaeon]|nr:HAD family hydrolase [Candidatus Heimdallarchaeota archaeon]MDH5645531.1 HAD family hydrolase [Candidatus Heimdallarchaeota archaeon]
MSSDQPVLFIDLHGVLVNTPIIFEEYRRITIEHLMTHFGLNEISAKRRYDTAMEIWEKYAFDYLRDPTKEKVGSKFLEFLEFCDKIFPQTLYQDLKISADCTELRTRPFEFSVAQKVKALYPEVKDTLNRLIAHGYDMHVASSSHSSHIKGILKGNDIEEYFGNVFGFDTVAATKHTLKFYKKMLSKVNADPKTSIMIGNSMHEVIKPKKIGMLTIHINRERKVPLNIRKMANYSLMDIASLPIHLDTIQIVQ